jgi:hypothetical protein
MRFGSPSIIGVGAGGAGSGGVEVRFLLRPERAEARAGSFRFLSIAVILLSLLSGLQIRGLFERVVS